MSVRNLAVAGISMVALLAANGADVPLVFADATTSTAMATSTTTLSTSTSNPYSQSDVKAKITSYFADIPVMISIADCESGFRQFTANGNVLVGGNGSMVGIFQLDETVHRAKALSLGFDIDTVDGNMDYARYLFGAEGTGPWISSFPCWNASENTPPVIEASSSATPALTMNLSLGMIDPQVLTLQKLLNQTGYTLTASGPGSPGSETTLFGALTRAAVERLQCAKGITCSGDEFSTGYGYVDAPTRAVLLSLAVSSTIPIATTTAGTSTTTSTPPQNSGQLAELRLQIVALTALLLQLEQEVATKFGK